MGIDQDKAEQARDLLSAPDLATALESDHFRLFLDQIPIAIVLAEIDSDERIVYANPEFEKISGQPAAQLEGRTWDALRGIRVDDAAEPLRELPTAIVDGSDRLGVFRLNRDDGEFVTIDAYANVIVDEQGEPAFRLAALVSQHPDRAQVEEKLRTSDILLRELQHRVRNNLQMITALIRLEARNARNGDPVEQLQRLAGRIEAMEALYRSLEQSGTAAEVDLGAYLSQVASAVMRAQAVEGIRLDLKVDAYPVSINVAMPTGLLVNELLTNSLKHAFEEGKGGTITVQSLTDDEGCLVTIADDGKGMENDTSWPQRGKLSALVVSSLKANADASVTIRSAPGSGMRVSIRFARSAAKPTAEDTAKATPLPSVAGDHTAT